MKDPKRIGKPYRATFQSDRKEHRVVRRLVKRALQRREEPQPRYRTGKFWVD